MIKDILLYIWGRILGYEYSCDRCSSLGHTYMTIGIIDYIRNKRVIKNESQFAKFMSDWNTEQKIPKKITYHYCEWCWNWINLKNWECKCGNKGTLRSSHQNLITCTSCYNLVKCK